MKYPIYEVFNAFQGEGVHAGRSAFFIRLYGCPVHCPWCDSAGTWHPKFLPEGISKRTPDEILEAYKNHTGPEFVVVTGGEPAIHDMRELVDRFLYELPVHLETSGAFEIRGEFSWITLSPKKWKLPLRENLLKAHEFKVIVETPEDIEFYSDVIGKVARPIWLHPEWSQRENKDVLSAITSSVKGGNGRFRAGWQIHKMYQCDAVDARSRPLVPLGGDIAKGY